MAQHDDGIETEYDVPTALKEEYAGVVRRFDALVEDTHLPFLEVRLYRKYFVQVQTAQRLDNFKTVVGVMQEHRMQTLRILKLISEREQIVAQLGRKADDFAKQKVSTLEVQTEVLQLLHQHQQVTLKVIEGVGQWRNTLTRKYPFHWCGKNYLLKVLEDCAFIDSCELRSILPLRVAQFPLCSNIASLSLFSPGSLSGGKPQAAGKKGGASPETNKLRAAEAALFDEEQLQQKLMRELDAVAATGHFIPLLNLPRIVPACTTGIRISNTEWTQQLSEAIEEAQSVNRARAEDEDHDDSAAPTPAKEPKKEKKPANDEPSPARHSERSSRSSSRSPSRSVSRSVSRSPSRTPSSRSRSPE